VVVKIANMNVMYGVDNCNKKKAFIASSP